MIWITLRLIRWSVVVFCLLLWSAIERGLRFFLRQRGLLNPAFCGWRMRNGLDVNSRASRMHVNADAHGRGGDGGVWIWYLCAALRRLHYGEIQWLNPPASFLLPLMRGRRQSIIKYVIKFSAHVDQCWIWCNYVILYYRPHVFLNRFGFKSIAESVLFSERDCYYTY